MSWIEVRAVFKAPPSDWSIYIDAFERHGCENTLQEDQPPSLSSAVVNVSGCDEVVRALSADLLRLGAVEVITRSLVEENWEEHWKQFFHPRKVGRRILVRPSWEQAPPSDRIEIVLDPGQAFGTGDHPTTRMCLELLERHPANTIADVGCGSGILSIAACKLGASKVFAVDVEPLSVGVARENAALNGVEVSVICGRGIKALSGYGPFDLVVSNIISAVLIQIAGEVAQNLRGSGIWLVSGIIVDNWVDVRDAAESFGFYLTDRMEEDGWVAAAFKKT